MDDSLIKRAKKYAREKGVSVSRLVANYFSALGELPASNEEDLPPITTSLSGILKDTDLDEKDYKKHLEEKYLQ